MSKRLQVLVDETEWRQLQRIARAKKVTVASWVRSVLRAAAREEATGGAAHKLAALRRATRHEFPAPDIEEMLAEIEGGYTSGSA